MSLNAKKVNKSVGKFERPDALESGTYPARIVQLIGLGLQKQRPYMGEEKDPQQVLYVTYELSDEFLMDGEGNDMKDKPRWISEEFPLFNLGSDLAKSTKRYYAIDPKCKYDGEWPELISKPVMVTLTQSPSKKDPKIIYNNVSSTQTARSKDVDKMPDLANAGKVFDFYEPNLDMFLTLPEWLQERIKEGLDYPGSQLEDMLSKAPASGSEEQGENKEDKGGDNEDW